MQTGTFNEMTMDELRCTDGGFLPFVLFAIWGVEVTVGMAVTAGVAVGLVAGGAVALKN